MSDFDLCSAPELLSNFLESYFSKLLHISELSDIPNFN